jgi:hypothetical protein
MFDNLVALASVSATGYAVAWIGAQVCQGHSGVWLHVFRRTDLRVG